MKTTEESSAAKRQKKSQEATAAASPSQEESSKREEEPARVDPISYKDLTEVEQNAWEEIIGKLEVLEREQPTGRRRGKV
jgi:hypothetical protein